MNFRNLLTREHSKTMALQICEAVLKEPGRMKELIGILTGEEYRLVQRAAWPVGMLGEKRPELFLPYLSLFLHLLKQPKHDAVGRNIYRSLQYLRIPENLIGRFYDQCIRDIEDPKKAIAIRVFAMTVAFNISKNHKELQTELKLVIGEHIDTSPGFHSRGKKILKAIG